MNNFLRIVFFSVRFEMENIDKNSDKFWFPFWESISTTFQVNQLHLFLKSHKDIIADINQFVWIQCVLRLFFQWLKISSNQLNDKTLTGNIEKKSIQIRTPNNDGTTIHQKMSNYIQNIKLLADVHQRFFPCHPFHFLECWYHLLILNDMNVWHWTGKER